MAGEPESLSLEEAYARAVAYHAESRFAEAETLYRRILKVSPDEPDVLHMLGLLGHQCGHGEQAVELIGKALSLRQTSQFWSNLAVALLGLNRLEEARRACGRALELDPGMIEAHLNLAQVLDREQKPAESAEYYRKAIALGASSADVRFRLGSVLFRANCLPEALAVVDEAIAMGKSDAPAHFVRGRILHELQRSQEAVAAYRAALDIEPRHADAAFNLGLVYQDLRLTGQAETMLKWALDLSPDNPIILYNLSRLLRLVGRISGAIKAAARAVELKPDFALAHQALGNAYHAGGQIELAQESFRKGAALAPDDFGIHHNVIACLRLDWRVEGEVFRDAYREWNARHLGSIPRLSHANAPDPERRLRIGYVSPDYRNHAVAYFLEPLIRAHDRERFEITCYSQVDEEDAVTRRFQDLADRWRVILPKSDDEAAAMIQADGIDILVDCAGHTVGMRMHVFARKPAPVQVTTLVGHDTTTGVAAIDYILSDPYLTPPGYEDHFTETLVRMPHVVAPFLPRDDWPEVPPLPEGEGILFGCFAEPSRIGDVSLGLWTRILDRVPGSRLLLKHKTFEFPDQAKYWRSRFARLGDGRFDLEGVPGGWLKEMTVYGRVGVILDSFPLTGATSSLIPLWMGVPVVTLAGHLAGQRYGVTMLSNAGVPELVASDQDGYVELAVALATDRPRLARYRAGLRGIVRDSPILDAAAVTAAVEESYRRMWRQWCEGRSGKDGDHGRKNER